MPERATPVAQKDSDIVRSEGVVPLWDQQKITATTAYTSDPVQCGPYRKFALYIRLASTSTPTTLQLVPQFLEPKSGKWHDMREGIFASLFFEDTVHATERDYVFHGDCAGRQFRLYAIGVGTSSSAYFTLSASVEFYN